MIWLILIGAVLFCPPVLPVLFGLGLLYFLFKGLAAILSTLGN